MKRKSIKPVSRLQLALKIKKLKDEVKQLKHELIKKDTLLHKKACEIARLKNSLAPEKLTFRERLFGKKAKKSESRKVLHPSLRGLQDQIVALLKSGYSDEDIAQLFNTTKKNLARFIKRHGLR